MLNLGLHVKSGMQSVTTPPLSAARRKENKDKGAGRGGGWKPGEDIRGEMGGLRKDRRQGNKEQR